MTTSAPRAIPAGWLLLLAGAALLVLGVSITGLRPLTMHEGRLPETSREMIVQGDFLVPGSGGRPWVERPPLPHWITIATVGLFVRDGAVWAARIPPFLMAVGVVLATVSTARPLVGHRLAMLAGLFVATMVELVTYAWLAEDDIFLLCIFTCSMAVAVKMFVEGPVRGGWLWRGAPGLVLCVLLGLLNLVKGPAFGMVLFAVAMGGGAVAGRLVGRVARSFWWLGLPITAVLGATWYVLAEMQVPGSARVWAYDLFGRVGGDYEAITRPWHYYLAQLPVLLLPWTPLAIVGVIAVVRERIGLRVAGPWPVGIALGWAVAPVVVLSLLSGKHHHYLLYVLPAWAILAALGASVLWTWVRSLPAKLINPWLGLAAWGVIPAALVVLLHPRLHWPLWAAVVMACGFLAAAWGVYIGFNRNRAEISLAAIMLALLPGFAFVNAFTAPVTDQTLDDRAFLLRIPGKVPAGATLAVVADERGMDFFRVQYALPPGTRLLHNLSYLRDPSLGREVFVVGRAMHAAPLLEFGEWVRVDQSRRSRRESEHGGALTLYRVTLKDRLVRCPPISVNPMQAMRRQRGPVLEP